MTKDFLDQVEMQLVTATERGGKRRRLWQLRGLYVRLPTFAVAALGVTAVTATALAAELALPAGHVKHTPPAVQTVASPTLTPDNGSGFQPQSFTAIGEFTWWLMGPRTCGTTTCIAIAQTTDGGPVFHWLTAPATGTGVSQLRFANAEDGYAFDPQLWSTDNDAQSWTPVNLGGQVKQLMASGEYVYAIVLPPNGGAGKLMRSQVGSNSWTTLTSAGDLQSSLWVQDQYVLVESSGGELLISDDYGATFTGYKAPPSVQCSFEWASASVIWEPCATGMMSGIWRSTDGGATYHPAGGDSDSKGPEFANSMAFGAASPTTAVMGDERLYRTTDGGSTFVPVRAPIATEWQYIGFTDGTHGAAIGLFGTGSSQESRVYYTIDAGASYHLVPIKPT
jgi:hypothetical protein